MAKTGTLTNVLRGADGLLVSGVAVTARLVPEGGFRIDDSSEITPPVPVITATTGAWSMQLEQNSNIYPSGSYWEITENLTAEQARIWSVSIGAGFQTLKQALVSAPAPATTQISLSANNVWTGTTQFNNNVGFFGTTPVSQPGQPATLADVIAALQALGLVRTNP